MKWELKGMNRAMFWVGTGAAVAGGVWLVWALVESAAVAEELSRLSEYGSAALAITLGIGWSLLGWVQDAWSGLTKLENLPFVFLTAVLCLVFWIRDLFRYLDRQLADIRTLLWSISESQKRDQ